MNKPEDDDQRSLLAMIFDPPTAIAGLCALMAVLHVALAFAPARLARQAWRLFEVSPKPMLMALERGDLVRVARAFLGHMFFHVNAAHLLLNVAAILTLGAIAYREMEARDGEHKNDAAVSFLAFFLISGMAAAAVFILVTPESYRPMIGASGGAAGLAGACAWIFVTRASDGQPRSGALRNGFFLVLISAALIASSIYFDTSPLSLRLFGSVSAWQAHVGGYVFGVVAYPLFERMAGARRQGA